MLVGPGATFFSTNQMIGLRLELSMFDRIVVPGLTKDLISGTRPTLLNSGHNLDQDYSLILLYSELKDERNKSVCSKH